MAYGRARSGSSWVWGLGLPLALAVAAGAAAFGCSSGTSDTRNIAAGGGGEGTMHGSSTRASSSSTHTTGSQVTTGAGGEGGAGGGEVGSTGGATRGTGGSGGGICQTPNDCPAPPTPCEVATCQGGVCGVDFATVDTPASQQTAGDCLSNVCDGMGNIITINAPGDVPTAMGDCYTPSCQEDGNGVDQPTQTPVSIGMMCGNGHQLCDASGGCVDCLTSMDCPGADNECQTRTCTTGVCGFDFAPDDTPVTMQTPGDCQQIVCDGSGGTTSINDLLDVPADANDCTTAACAVGSNGVAAPTQTPDAFDSPCSAGHCDGAGTCFACVTGNDCSSLVCASHTCAAPTCTDAVRNEDETDVDCGGLRCPACVDGKRCLSGADCIDKVCKNNACAMSTCTDLVQNGAETDTDCGGGACPGCGVGKKCSAGADCASGLCNTNKRCTTAIVLTDNTSAFASPPPLGVNPAARSLPDSTVAVLYGQTVTISGGDPPYAISWAGAAPTGVNLTTAAASASVAGTPTTAGQRPEFTLTVTDTAGGSANRLYDLRAIAPAPAITSSTTLPSAKANAAYTDTLTETNGTTPLSWSTSSTLPTGLGLSAAGVVSGTPLAAAATGGTNGSYSGLSITLTDSLTDRLTGAAAGRTSNQSFSIYVKTSYRLNIIPFLGTSGCEPGCHSSGFSPNFFGSGTTAATATASGIIGIASNLAGSCPGRTYIVTGNTSTSLVDEKVDSATSPCGSCMPTSGCQTLPLVDRQLLIRWISTDIVGTD
jgi:hypothetical protein